MLNTQTQWQAVKQRDASLDGQFVYAVHSTGVYCRPSCPSRKPKREHVSFFALPELAKQKGYRACKRCQPDSYLSERSEKIQAICRYIESHQEESLNLEHLAHTFSLSPSHLQKTFKESVGISPQAYLETCRMEAIKEKLQAGDDISGATYEAGYSSSSQLYARAKTHFGMTPKTYKQKGKDTLIMYTVTNSPLGKLLVAATAKGICSVRLGKDKEGLEQELRTEFSQAEIIENAKALKPWVDSIVNHLKGKEPHLDLPLDVQATAFQKRVWQELQAIPYGETRSYSEVAEAIGKPKAVRAVASACAKNPTALVVPCHRVVRSDGSMGGYRWGVERKIALLKQERR